MDSLRESVTKQFALDVLPADLQFKVVSETTEERLESDDALLTLDFDHVLVHAKVLPSIKQNMLLYHQKKIKYALKEIVSFDTFKKTIESKLNLSEHIFKIQVATGPQHIKGKFIETDNDLLLLFDCE
ncbi:hypothetical protein RFI_00510, partial [Reticulomyxa filosa]